MQNGGGGRVGTLNQGPDDSLCVRKRPPWTASFFLPSFFFLFISSHHHFWMHHPIFFCIPTPRSRIPTGPPGSRSQQNCFSQDPFPWLDLLRQINRFQRSLSICTDSHMSRKGGFGSRPPKILSIGDYCDSLGIEGRRLALEIDAIKTSSEGFQCKNFNRFGVGFNNAVG
jgi:hypothetical protein